MRGIRRKLQGFDVEQVRRSAFAGCDRGIQFVEVSRIVGSVGRATELNSEFRYCKASRRARQESEARLRRIRALFDANAVSAVELYQIGPDYFVLDGHHRVAVARERGQEYLDAHVVEYRPARGYSANGLQSVSSDRSTVRAPTLKAMSDLIRRFGVVLVYRLANLGVRPSPCVAKDNEISTEREASV